jgi:periplasmic divalent cation tolerance protein
MSDSLTTARIVLTTASSLDEARHVGRTLVEEHLAACTTIIPAVESIYRWQGAIETSTETLLLIKTTVDLIPALQTRLLELHSYETPEFLVLAVESGSSAYLDWLTASVLQR